jgi:predicted 3-demethylubiquinone-9 3-methyltransferase (glyoxalase superfamily)
MVTPQRISPNLWFDDQAEEAARFYIGIFKNSRIRDDQSIRQGRVRDSPSAGRIGGDGGRVRAGN